jgi:hypothetical protein
MWLNTFYISNIGVIVFLKWSTATITSYSRHLYLAGCWDLGTTHQKTVYICQYYGFTSLKMLFYWLIILNNIILMIDNDQSTIIEASEVYKSIPTHCPPTFQRHNQGRNPISILTSSMDMLWSILLNQTFRCKIGTYEYSTYLPANTSLMT